MQELKQSTTLEWANGIRSEPLSDDLPWPEETLPKRYLPTLRVKRLTETAKLPTKAHATDLGYDLYADEDVVIPKGATTKIKTGIAIGFPEGWGGIIKDRSSMAAKAVTTSGGVIDQAYIGELSIIMTFNSTVFTNLKNHGDCINYSFSSPDNHLIKKGDKIAQLVLTPVTNFPIHEVAELEETDRGTKGFGSSGK